MASRSKQPKALQPVGDRRRRDLLAAAYELIAQKGLEGLRTRDIVLRAGVNISALHYYFGTKEALLEAVVLFVAQKFAGEGELAQAPVDQTLNEHLERVQATFESNPELAIVLQELALRAQRDAATRASLRSIYKFWNRQVADVLRAEIAAGTMPRDADADELALLVTSFVTGAMTQQGVNAKALDFEALARRLVRLFTGGSRSVGL